MKVYEIITEARTPLEKEYDLPTLKKDPVDDAELYGMEHDQPYELNTDQFAARKLLQILLPKLSPDLRKVIVLYSFHGMREDEIAKKYGVSLIHIRKLHMKALRKLRTLAAQYDTGFERDPTAWFESLLAEAKLGTQPKRPTRKGSRPERGHEPVKRYKDEEPANEEMQLDEKGKASRRLCLSTRPDSELGASNLASCKSQGLRARDGEKSHKVGKGKRVKVGGHKIKGKKYGGPLPDWGTRK